LRGYHRFASRSAALLLVAEFALVRPSLAAETSERDGASTTQDSEPAHPLKGEFSIAALAGFGTDGGVEFATDVNEATGESSPDPNPFGPALGLRGAYDLQAGPVLSVTLLHHFGGTDSQGRQVSSALLEVGWAFAAGPLALEPFVGLGGSWLRATNELCSNTTGECWSSVGSNAATSAGVGLMASLPLSERFFVGARAQVLGMVGPELGMSGFGLGGLRL
jgi:hypothetical protein